MAIFGEETHPALRKMWNFKKWHIFGTQRAVFGPKNGISPKSLKLPQNNFITSLQTKNGEDWWKNAPCTARKLKCLQTEGQTDINRRMYRRCNDNLNCPLNGKLHHIYKSDECSRPWHYAENNYVTLYSFLILCHSEIVKRNFVFFWPQKGVKMRISKNPFHPSEMTL